MSDTTRTHQLKSYTILDKLFKDYRPNQIGFAFNGGKDSCVVLELLRKNYPQKLKEILVVHFVDEDEFDEVTTFVENTQKKYNLKLIYIHKNIKEGLTEICQNYPELKTFIIGYRNTDPYAPLEPFSPTSNGWPNLIRVSPILDWTYKQVWDFLRDQENSGDFVSLYALGYTSLGSVNNSVRNPKLLRKDGGYDPAWMLEDERFERDSRI